MNTDQAFKNKPCPPEHRRVKRAVPWRRAVMWAAMAAIVLLILLSIYGAFLGPERAKQLFNGIPLVVYWAAFILLLAVGITLFRRLLRVPALLLVHAGCILILAGAMWGSQTGHELESRLLGIDKIPTGQMQIYEGYSDNRVISQDNQIRELPFHVRLKDFRIEYYKAGKLRVQTRQGEDRTFAVEIGKRFSPDPEFGTLEIVRVFENFKITIDGDNRTVIDDSGAGSNPALEVRIDSPNGQAATRYVFERFPGHTHQDDELLLSYERVISDYISELQVIRDGRVVARKDIEVNHPLHYGGYHFYQHSYDDQAGEYTILTVASDTGLGLVYGGYLALCVGVFWRFWLRRSAKPADRLTEKALESE
jgi:hypothetical protein